MALRLVTAGESHGPALVAVVTGLPAGLRLDRAAIDADLTPSSAGLRAQPAPAARDRRRRRPHGAAPRPHARHAADARRLEPRPQELALGHVALGDRGRAERQGREAGDAARGPATPTSRASSSTDHDDVRNALERASARHTAAHVAAGAVAKALLGELGISVRGAPVEIGGATGDDGMREATDARARPGTRSAASSRSSPTAVRPGSAPTRRRPTGSMPASPSR